MKCSCLFWYRPRYGPDYIIPAPFDPRLIRDIPPAVAKAALESGVARMPIVDEDVTKIDYQQD